MRIVSFWCGDLPEYQRMARVLRATAMQHHVRCTIRHVDDPVANRSDAFLVKARRWTQAIVNAHDGERLLLLDVDTFFLGDASAGFDAVTEIGVTTRGSLATLNSGVLFVRVNPRVRAWIQQWEARTRPWRERNEGLREPRFGDQDALRELCTEGGVDVQQLPCSIFNAQQHCWPPVDGCKIVHLKSDARRIVFGGRLHGNVGADVVARMWLEREQALGSPLTGSSAVP